MKICIDTRSPGKTGILTFTRCLLSQLVAADNQHEYMVITDPEFGTWGLKGVEEVVVPSNNPIYWMIWSNTILPRILKERKVDIYHSFKHITLFRTKVKKMVTLHGVHMHYRMPELFKWHETVYWKLATAMALKTYDCIVTDAYGELNYFVETRGCSREKFRVAYVAGDDRFHESSDEEKKRKTKEKYGLQIPYILYVGMIHPRKNLDGLIEGYSMAKQRIKTDHKLVVVGDHRKAYFSQISALVNRLGIQDDVQFLGYVPDEDLPDIYQLADMFLFPSHYEGFGIVLMEAMACGLPVITSNIEDIVEAVGDAAELVNSKNKSEIGDAIVKVLSSNEMRKSLREKSLARSRLFSWDRCAKETINIYDELFHSR